MPDVEIRDFRSLIGTPKEEIQFQTSDGLPRPVRRETGQWQRINVRYTQLTGLLK